MLKAAVIASGVVPPGIEGSGHSLQDLLADTPPAPLAAADDYGLGVLCHVPAPARSRIDWLAGNASDWFYYDPVAGVMEVRWLR